MVLIDTSIWVDYLRGVASAGPRRAVERLLDDHEAVVTPVIQLELLRGASLEEAKMLRDLFEGLHQLPFESHHWQRADDLVIRLRARGVTPAIPDLLIATSALAYRMPLYHHDATFDAIAQATDLKLYHPTSF